MMKAVNAVRKELLLYNLAFFGVFVFCTAGGMYNSIRRTNWMGVRDNKPEWIHRQGRSQHGFESVIVGCLNAGGALSVVLLTYLLRAGFEVNVKDRVRRVVCLLIPAFIPCFVMLACWYLIVHIYTIKNGHFNHGFVGMTG